MPRTSLTVTNLSRNGDQSTASAVYTTIDATLVTNGGYIAKAAGPLDKLFILVKNTNASNRVMTLKAGEGDEADPPGPAFLSGAGDLAVTVEATTGEHLVGPFESARFLRKDGTINVDFAASFAGSIAIFRLPQGRG